jgi:hypothetical protein
MTPLERYQAKQIRQLRKAMQCATEEVDMIRKGFYLPKDALERLQELANYLIIVLEATGK